MERLAEEPHALAAALDEAVRRSSRRLHVARRLLVGARVRPDGMVEAAVRVAVRGRTGRAGRVQRARSGSAAGEAPGRRSVTS